MGDFSIWHWTILFFYIFAVGLPIAKILGRLGLSKALVILAFIPLVNLIALWLLAYATWPAVRDDSEIFS